MSENRLRGTVVFLQTKKQTEKNMENNKNMNPVFSLKNFRSFGEEGADFELAPITILTGCNSAGKSSMAKALVLLSRMPNHRRVVSPSLKLYTKDLRLGNYEKVLHKNAADNEIVFAYKVWSNYLQEDVRVKRFFKSKKNDDLNDGYLYKYSIEKTDGTIIFEENTALWEMEDEEHYNKHIDSIIQNFNAFSLVSKYQQLVQVVDLLIKRNDEESQNKYAHYSQELKDIVSQIQVSDINVEMYNIRQLSDWDQWIYNRDKEIKDWKPYCKTDEEFEDLLTTQYPERQIIEHYLELVVDEVFSPRFTENVEYIDSGSAAIRRTYSVEDSNKMSKALFDFNSAKIIDKEWSDIFHPYYHKPGSFVNHWLEEFLGKGCKVFTTGDGEGRIKVFIERNGEKRLLADEGYGITQLVSLLLLIDNSIKSANENNLQIPWRDGKPDHRNSYYERYPQVICVEEPEVHLHPKYQSLLAEMFVEAYQKYNLHFIIETHSEYLIRKLQVMVADKENALSPNDVSLNYVEKDENGVSTNRKIEIMEDGRLGSSFGDGFFDEAGSLSRKLFTLNK